MLTDNLGKELLFLARLLFSHGGSSFVNGIISFSISHITTQLSEHEWKFTSSYIGVAAFPGVYFFYCKISRFYLILELSKI